MNRALVVIGLALLAACAKPASSPVASRSACPETLPDIDRLACWVSARPEAAPDARKPPALLRNVDGTAVIGPTSGAPLRNPDGSPVTAPGSPQ